MIQAIPTVYRGIQMRSKLEARAAEAFDAWGVKWLYEVEGFDIDGVWYLPDFWLPDLKSFVEVKGILDDSVQKTQALARRAPKGVRVFLAMAEHVQRWAATSPSGSSKPQLAKLNGYSQEIWNFIKCPECKSSDFMVEDRPHCVSVYLAGKVRGSKDWRLDIVPDLRKWTANNPDGQNDWQPIDFKLEGLHAFKGPFFLTDRESTTDAHEREWNGASHLGGIGGYKAHDNNSGRRDDLQVDCLLAIRKSNLVFAWLDDLTAFGTLVEIGYAAALKRCVLVGGPGGEIDDELWFARRLVDVARGNTPREAFADAIRQWRYGFTGRSFA